MLSILFYLAVFALVFVLQAYAMKQKNRNWQLFVVICSFVILLSLIGFRYNVGTDYSGHIETYNKYSHMSFSEIWSSKGDVGSKLIIGFASHILGDEKIIFWIYGLLALYPIYKINKNSKFKYLAYSVLVFNLTTLPVCLNILRQGAAMSFALLAFNYARTNSGKYKVLISMLIAILLHTSALLMLPFIFAFMFAKRQGKKYYLVSAILAVVISVIMTTVLKDVLTDIGFLDYNYMLRVSNSLGLSLSTAFYDSVYYVMLFIVFFVFRKDQLRSFKKHYDSVKDMVSMMVCGTIFEVAGTVTRFLSRISYYFSIYQVILLPEMLQNIKNRNSRIAMKTLCISVLVSLFIFRCYVMGSYEIIPYQTWLFEGDV